MLSSSFYTPWSGFICKSDICKIFRDLNNSIRIRRTSNFMILQSSKILRNITKFAIYHFVILNPIDQRSILTNQFPSFFPNPSLSIRFFSSNTIFVNFMVRLRGLEPPRSFDHQSLKLAWLPLHHRRI